MEGFQDETLLDFPLFILWMTRIYFIGVIGGQVGHSYHHLPDAI
jgi:hypothetical protein